MQKQQIPSTIELLDDVKQQEPSKKDFEYIRLKSATINNRTQRSRMNSGFQDAPDSGRAATANQGLQRQQTSSYGGLQRQQTASFNQYQNKGEGTSNLQRQATAGRSLFLRMLQTQRTAAEDIDYGSYSLNQKPSAMNEYGTQPMTQRPNHMSRLNLASDSSHIASSNQLISMSQTGNQIINLTTSGIDETILEPELVSSLPKPKKRRNIYSGLSSAGQISAMIGQLNKLQKKRDPLKRMLIRRAEKHSTQYDRMSGIVERNIQRNEGERAFLAEDKDMINILSTYRI